MDGSSPNPSVRTITPGSYAKITSNVPGLDVWMVLITEPRLTEGLISINVKPSDPFHCTAFLRYMGPTYARAFVDRSAASLRMSYGMIVSIGVEVLSSATMPLISDPETSLGATIPQNVEQPLSGHQATLSSRPKKLNLQPQLPAKTDFAKSAPSHLTALSNIPDTQSSANIASKKSLLVKLRLPHYKRQLARMQRVAENDNEIRLLRLEAFGRPSAKRTRLEEPPWNSSSSGSPRSKRACRLASDTFDGTRDVIPSVEIKTEADAI